MIYLQCCFILIEGVCPLKTERTISKIELKRQKAQELEQKWMEKRVYWQFIREMLVSQWIRFPANVVPPRPYPLAYMVSPRDLVPSLVIITRGTKKYIFCNVSLSSLMHLRLSTSTSMNGLNYKGREEHFTRASKIYRTQRKQHTLFFL